MSLGSNTLGGSTLGSNESSATEGNGFIYTLPTISGSHSNFPIVLKENDFPLGAINGSTTAIDDGGGNLRAYTNQLKTTQLSVEIVTFSSGVAPEAQVWIKVPTVETGAQIYIEADDTETSQPAVDASYGARSVWDDYAAVYHCDTLNNSASASGTLTANGDAAIDTSTGIVGNSFSFDGTGDYFSTTGFYPVTGSSDRVVSAWMKYTDTSLAASTIKTAVSWGSDNGVTSGARYSLSVDNLVTANEAAQIGVNGGNSNGSADIVSGIFKHVTAKLEGTDTDDITFFVDGATDSVDSFASNTINTGSALSLMLGRNNGVTTQDWDGNLDEIRIRDANVSDVDEDWTETEFNNQSSSGGWGTVGDWDYYEGTAYGFTYTLPTMAGTHTDFPVILREFDFPSEALEGGSAIVNGGLNLVAYTDDTKTTQIPLEITHFVTGVTPYVEIHVKVPTAETGSTIYFEADDTQTAQPSAGSTYGSEAVWTDYEAVWHFKDGVDSSGNEIDLLLSGTPSYSGSDLDVVGAPDDDYAYINNMAMGFTSSDTVTTQVDFYLDGLSGGGGSFDNALLDLTSTYGLGIEGGGSNLLIQFTFGGYANSSTGLSTGNRYRVTTVWDQSGQEIKFYINGVLDRTVAHTDTSSHTSGTYKFNVNDDEDDDGIDGQYAEGRLRLTDLSDEWVEDEYDNHDASTSWGTQGTWESTSTGTTVSATAVSLSLTTYNPDVTVEVDTVVSAGTSSLSLTTYNPSVTVEVDTIVNSTVASLNFTTYNPTVSVGVDTNVSVASQALSITTYPATVATGNVILASSVAMSITTYPATVEYTTDAFVIGKAMHIIGFNGVYYLSNIGE